MCEEQPATSTGAFPTTAWTQVLHVIQGGDRQAAEAALSTFCECYLPAVRNFFLRRGVAPHDAEDCAQEFFRSRILKGWEQREGFLHTAQRAGQGKFRSFLCHVLWRFLQDKWKAERTARSGGGLSHVPLDGLDLAEDAGGEAFAAFGRAFDREFARQIIQKAAERSEHAKYLQAHLRGQLSQAEAARELGLSENAFRQAYHRFRERLGDALWAEVAAVVGPDPKEIQGEIEYLMSLFRDDPA